MMMMMMMMMMMKITITVLKFLTEKKVFYFSKKAPHADNARNKRLKKT